MEAGRSRGSASPIGSLRTAAAAGVAILAAALCVSSCTSAPVAGEAAPLRFLSGIALTLAEDLVGRYNKRVPGARFVFETKAGSVVVVSALEKGEGELGFVQADVVYLAYRRGIETEQYPHTSLRGLAVLWVNNLYIAAQRDGPIRTIADLRGRRVGVLRPGTSGEHVTRIVLGAYGMTYADLNATFDTGRALLGRMQRGELEATITSYPVPLPELSQLARSGSVRLIPVGRDATNQLRADYPFLRRIIIPPPQLQQSEPIETFGTEYLLVGRQDLGEEVAYQLTKEFFSALPELAGKYPEAARIDPELGPTTPIPLHPGAARYYREREILK